MIVSLKEWAVIVSVGTLVGAGLAVLTRMPWPTCKPGDRGIYIGHVMLMGGCPDTAIDSEGRRLIYRNDGSIGPP